MFKFVWQQISKSRGRQYACLAVACLAVFLAGWFWNDFCLWRADANLILRRHAAAEWWVNQSRTSNAKASLIRLRIARRLGRYDAVQTLLQEARNQGVPSAELQREQWLAMAQTQQFDKVNTHWHELLSDPRDDEPEIAKAYVIWAVSHDEIATALHVLDLWIQDYPQAPEPYALHGQIALALNKDQGAVDAYRNALARAPNNNEYRLALAKALRNQLQLAEAAKLFEQCLKADANNLAALEGLGGTFASLGELEKAESILEAAVKRHPDHLEFHRTLGEVYLAKGNDAAAIPHLERAYSAQPENADLAYSLAQALNATNRKDEATALFEFVAESRGPLDRLKPMEEELRSRPNDLDLRFQIASVSAKYKSRQEAIRWLEKLLLISPTYRPAHEALVELYRLRGDPQKSAKHQKILEALSKAAGH